MLKVKRFINELMSSNCYILWDDISHKCVIIDPASENSLSEIGFIEGNNLVLDYIILTHEHTDHTWGVNNLLDEYPEAKVICHRIAKDNMNTESKAYFRLYYNDPSYSYKVRQFDVVFDEALYELVWNNTTLRFIHVPGHSMGSVCVLVNGWLFTGDTILQSKPYVNKRNGSKELFIESVKKLLTMFDGNQIILPGHGDQFRLKEYNVPYGILDKENL